MAYTFPTGWSDLNTVLAHDWLTGMRGGERCLELLCMGMPAAKVFTLVHQPEHICNTINSHPVTTSALQQIPILRKHFRWLLPFFPLFIKAMQLPKADLMISTSHCVAKGFSPYEGTRHLCYCFTPMRYGIFYNEYFGKNPVKKLAMQPALARLEAWDRRASERVDRFVAISNHVRKRIVRFYDREADVVYPPVDTDRCTPMDVEPGGFDLIVSALVPYKRVDLAVRAYNRLGYPLKIAGTGGEYRRLKMLAAPHIDLLGWKTDQEIVDLYRRCRFLIFPGEEDFGIVPLEAQACGKPVIAYGRGGALETLKSEKTGMFFKQPCEDELLAAIESARGKAWDPLVIRANAERFGTQLFLDNLDTSIQACRSN